MKGSSLRALNASLWLMRNINSHLQWLSENWPSSSRLTGRELIFQNLVHRQFDRIGFDQPLYPVRCAAGYSYLYLILRAIEELPVRRVLELGAGESTRLISHILAATGGEYITLEHDEFWAERLKAQVGPGVCHAPLVQRTVSGRSTHTYAAEALVDREKFDLLLIDGPPGSKRYSRWGVLEYIDTLLGEDFIIIFDDAERRGELDTIEAALKLLESKNRSYRARIIRSINSQFLIAGGRFEAAYYF